MNKEIKLELNKCKIANIPEYDEDTLEITILKHNSLDIIENHYYTINIDDYIINEPDNFTLSSNWNNGTKPPENTVRAKIEKIMGKMIKVNCIGVNSGKVWSGWLPRKSVDIVEEIN